MTVRRAAALAVGAFALIAVAKPPRPVGTVWDRYTSADSTKRVLEATGDSLIQLRAVARTVATRASVNRMLAAAPTSMRDGVIADERIAPSLRNHLSTVYAASRAKMPGSSMALPIFVVLDSTGELANSIQWLESPSAESPTCATVVQISASLRTLRDGRALATEVHRRLGPQFPQPRDFGLCGFEATFGAPSPVVRQWLRERGWISVRTGLSQALPPRPSSAFFYNYWGGRFDDGLYWVSFDGCIAGRLEECVDAVAPRLLGRTVDMESYSSERGTSRSRWGGRGSPDLMNALASSLGPQRFAELWRAADAPPDAYRRITGVPMDSLAHRVLVGDRPRRHSGATVSFGELIAVLLVAAAFAGISTLSHPRNRWP